MPHFGQLLGDDDETQANGKRKRKSTKALIMVNLCKHTNKFL